MEPSHEQKPAAEWSEAERNSVSISCLNGHEGKFFTFSMTLTEARFQTDCDPSSVPYLYL